MAACLIKTLIAEYPALADKNVHKRTDYKKGRVSVFVGASGLCTMAPNSSEITREAFRWDLDTVDKLEIDRQDLITKTMPMFERPEDSIQWCL
jgi:hypothetical protein